MQETFWFPWSLFAPSPAHRSKVNGCPAGLYFVLKQFTVRKEQISRYCSRLASSVFTARCLLLFVIDQEIVSELATAVVHVEWTLAVLMDKAPEMGLLSAQYQTQ